MDNQILLITIVIICSLAGWYIVLYKYLELRAILKVREQHGEQLPVMGVATNQEVKQKTKVNSSRPLSSPVLNGVDFAYDEHIPGMGPPPLANMGFHLPPEVLAQMKQKLNASLDPKIPPSVEPQNLINNSASEAQQKRLVCNWAAVLHLSGLALLTGIPFVNILAPTILWLFKKEQHPYLAKQGRSVINFQISLTLIQFLCLGLGVLMVWLMPNVAATLFAWTKTMRIIFSTGMYMPFNLFSIAPVLWGSVLTVRGAVAAYNGIAFSYPYMQEFVFANQVPLNNKHSEPAIKRREPSLNSEIKPKSGKISFG